MKSFLIALSLFAILVTGTVLNCLYLEKVTDELLDLEKAFPTKTEDGKSSPASAIEHARELWQKALSKIQLGANTKYLNAVTTALDNLTDYYEHGTAADYIAARSQFVESLKSLKRSDSLSLGNII